MNPLKIPVAKPDIDHPTLFKKGTGLCPRVLNSRTTPTKYHLGEKWESDKNRNKTQQMMHGKAA